MAGNEINQYAGDFVASIELNLGAAAPSAQLDELVAAAQQLTLATTGAATTVATWAAATARWTDARQQLETRLHDYLLDGLPAIPGLAELAGAVGWDSAEGLSGSLELGPLKLTLSSSSLTVQPTL
jgi:hypothetical protein